MLRRLDRGPGPQNYFYLQSDSGPTCVFGAKGRNLQWLGNGPLWALYFVVMPRPRGGPEPAAVAHAKAPLGLNLPFYRGTMRGDQPIATLQQNTRNTVFWFPIFSNCLVEVGVTLVQR